MRLIKYFIIFVILVGACFAAGWFYIANKITSEINEQYAGKKFFIKGTRGEEYYATFDKAVPSGFPFIVATKLIGWREESRTAQFTYSEPIIAGYNFITQNIFIDYSGEILAAYKPVAAGFGSNIKIQNYKIVIDFPISKNLLDIASKKVDPFELLNYLGEITVSTDKVEIFDLNEGVKFYDKQYEILNFSFTPAKYYLNLQDFLSNIPNEYNIKYQIETNAVEHGFRRVPISLFYGFFTFPSEFKGSITANIKTNAKEFTGLNDDINLNAQVSFTSPILDMPTYSLNLIKNIQNHNTTFKIVNEINIKLKEGFFDEIFQSYGVIHPYLDEKPKSTNAVESFNAYKIPAKMLDKQLAYMITNKDDFKFKDLENNSYSFNINLNMTERDSKYYINFQNLNVSSDNSSFNLKNNSEFKLQDLIGSKPQWNSKGIFLVTNFPSVVEYASRYIYRFGKYKTLSEEARSVYTEVNQHFLKSISDYPQSVSNDLSFEYDFDSKDLKDVKIGSVKLSDIMDLYEITFYHKLLDRVGIEGNVINKMKNIIPYIDENSKFLKEVLPKLTTNKMLEKLVPKDIKK